MEEHHNNPDNNDDSHWKLGIFYFNPNDKRAFLPKRMGAGWTLNLANPYVVAFLLAMIIPYIVYVIHMIVSIQKHK